MSYNKDVDDQEKIKKMSSEQLAKELRKKREAFPKAAEQLIDEYNKRIDEHYKKQRKGKK